jgi:magnesium transporter
MSEDPAVSARANGRFLAFRNGRGGCIALDEVGATLASKGDFVWLDLEAGEALLFDHVARQLAFHELALEDAVSAGQRTKLEDYGETLFMVAKSADWSDGRVALGEIHLFVGANFVVSVRHRKTLDFQRVRERLLRPGTIHRPSPGMVVYALLDHIVDEYRRVLELLHERYEQLESTVLEERLDRGSIVNLYEMKREILSLWSAVTPLEDVCGALTRLHPELVGKELKAYYRDISDHLSRVRSALGQLREAVSDALQLSVASTSLYQNTAVQKLAGWGALLALPTVVFSLYGMNFKHMPELDWPWGYPALLALTASGCALLYRKLKKSGWL